MNAIDILQRLEEIQLALAGTFESPKAPAVSAYQDGATTWLSVSWVVETGRDTTLDARCVAKLKISDHQIEHYAALDTSKRRVVQERLVHLLRQRVGAMRSEQPATDDCSLELDIDDAVFNVPDEPYIV